MSKIREAIAGVVKEAARMQAKYDKKQKYDVHGEMQSEPKKRQVSKYKQGTSKPKEVHGPMKYAEEKGFSDGFVEVLVDSSINKQAGLGDMLSSPLATHTAAGLGGVGLGIGGLLAAQRLMGGGEEEPDPQAAAQAMGAEDPLQGIPPELLAQMMYAEQMGGGMPSSPMGGASYPGGVQSHQYSVPGGWYLY